MREDHALLLQGGVFTEELVEAWIDHKIGLEVDPVRLRAHPFEFHIYYDM